MLVIANPFPTTQQMSLHMNITKWSILESDWLHPLQLKMEKLYTVSKKKTWSWLWLRSWATYSKFRLKLKKVGKTSRPNRYDLYQIPYNYTVEERNRVKGLDLIDRVNYGQRLVTLYRDSDQNHPKEKEMQEGHVVVWEVLQIVKKEKRWKTMEKGKITQLNAELQRLMKRDKKAFFNEKCKEIEEGKTAWKRLDISSRKLEVSRKYFKQGWPWSKDRNG